MPPPAASFSTGIFVDSPVQNLGYEAFPSGLSGKTNSNGRFKFMPGDLITFNIFGTQIGNAVPAASLITPLTLFNTTNHNDPRVVNLAQLLLTFGGIPSGSDPIVLPMTVPAGFPPTIDFSDLNFDSSFQTSLVSERDASAHLEMMFGFAYPLKIHFSMRYLVDQNGKPFLLVGDAAWSLIAALSDSDADFYLENRRQLGFTAVLVNLIEHKFTARPPLNFDGINPFTQGPFTTPDDRYFSHADHVLQLAASKGIVVLLAPLYLGFDCGDEGWCHEVNQATTSQMNAWGQYVGNRYKDYDNIIWVIGGDTDPSPVADKVQAMVDGIRSVDSRHLFTAHNAPEQMAVEPWGGNPWLTLNNAYTYMPAYESVLAAYELSPPMPGFLIEADYENDDGTTDQDLRAQSYWTLLSGGFGHVFGNCPIWAFGYASGFCASTDWKTQLNNVGSVSMKHFGSLFNSRHWQTLVPDLTHAIFITGGYGTFYDYASPACASDGSSIIGYLPSARTVSVNAACLAGDTMAAWWYNPRDGIATPIGNGTYATSIIQSFTPPSPGDWVLVLDSLTFSFQEPGKT
jgi:hypothetical protein